MPEKAVEEFKKIYKEEYGEELNDKEARDLAQNLLNIFRIIYRELPQESATF